MALELTSQAFAHNGGIPAKYTCDGADVSPPLNWSGAPTETRSFALVVDDPDAPDPEAPERTWVHWVLYNLPPETTQLPEAVTQTDLPTGTREGRNDWGRTGYGGPCPPVGRHRDFHKLYALDTVFSALDQPTKAQIEETMAGHILATAERIGTYAVGQRRKENRT